MKWMAKRNISIKEAKNEIEMKHFGLAISFGSVTFVDELFSYKRLKKIDYSYYCSFEEIHK